MHSHCGRYRKWAPTWECACARRLRRPPALSVSPRHSERFSSRVVVPAAVGGGAPLATYDACVYEEELFHHNTVVPEWANCPRPSAAPGNT